MAGDPEMAHLNRTLKEISHSLKSMTRILDTLNSNLVGLSKLFPQQPEENDGSSNG